MLNDPSCWFSFVAKENQEVAGRELQKRSFYEEASLFSCLIGSRQWVESRQVHCPKNVSSSLQAPCTPADKAFPSNVPSTDAAELHFQRSTTFMKLAPQQHSLVSATGIYDKWTCDSCLFCCLPKY